MTRSLCCDTVSYPIKCHCCVVGCRSTAGENCVVRTTLLRELLTSAQHFSHNQR